jgi:fluoride ion exporter CrcB/FEX
VKVIASYLGTWTLARVYSESVSVVSNLSNQAGKILTETINVIGAFVLGTISKVLTETVLIYDTIAKSLPKVFSESVAVVSESFNQGGKIFTETVSIIGQFVLGTISKLLTEVVKVYDTYLKEWTLSRVFTETVSVVSEALNQAGKSLRNLCRLSAHSF